MAVFATSDLRKLREAQHMSLADLAEVVNCDVSTLSRYESGKLKPNPDTMYQICEVLGDVNRWADWMRTEYPTSYGRVHPDIPNLSFEGTMMKMFAEVADIQELQLDALRDGADGKIDNPVLKEKLLAECSEAIAALQRFTNALLVQSQRGGVSNG